MKVSGKQGAVHTADTARELRLLTWAVTDPTNWHRYLALKADRPAFLAEMTEYYAQSLQYSRPEATLRAAQTYAFLIDETNYGRAQDGYTLTKFALGPYAGLILPPDRAPTDIAAQLLPLALTLPSKDAGFWQSALPLAVFTAQPDRILTPVLTRFTAAVAQSDDYMFRDGTPFPVPPFGPVLAAATTNPTALALILDRIANPDTPTTAFLKTALMYAAQANNLTAVRSLLDHGANPNRATDSSQADCSRPLERDHRTALMYAAENASAQLITMLLDGRADPKMKDTKGNRASWYLSKNNMTTDSERSALRQRLFPN